MSAEAILWAGYGVCAVATWRPVFRRFVALDNKSPYSRIDWTDVGFYAFFATLIAGCSWWLFWPGLAIRSLVKRREWTPKDFAERVGGRSRADKLKAREEAVRKREERIAQMELELGVVTE